MRDTHADYGGGDNGGTTSIWPALPKAPPPVELPPDFVPLFEPIPGCSDRTLGYVGDERFVVFRYEPRVEEVVWNDGYTYGFGAGGWRDFLDRIAPLADRYAAKLCLGSPSCPGTDVLVLDRHSGSAYFASRDSAERFLARRMSKATWSERGDGRRDA